uniref:Uncharacterized protein n=1 Tax=Trichogramma kaykai TaxID=54128 RepID=A0ABD2WK27_9HYME
MYRLNDRAFNKSAEYFKRRKSEELLRLRATIDWTKEAERDRVFRHVYHSIGPREKSGIFVRWLPDLRDIFLPAEIDRLLCDAVSRCEAHLERLRASFCWHRLDCSLASRGELFNEGQRFIEFVIETGYRDEPRCNELDGSLGRVTPLHHAARRLDCLRWTHVVEKLFQIYDRYDLNYTDETGLSHFHVACLFGLDLVARRFLQLGQSPDLLPRESVDPPLHLALRYRHWIVVELLLYRGASFDLPNKDGLTPLHLLCQTGYSSDCLTRLFFDIAAQLHKSVRVDARDRWGNTPLHLALRFDCRQTVKSLLDRDADPNLPNESGETPLHVACQAKGEERKLAKMLFGTHDRSFRLKLDARDKKGRTPLQWAVASCLPDAVELLLTRGADLASFRFPTVDYFVDDQHNSESDIDEFIPRIRRAAGTMLIVQRLEDRGYELEQSDALTIMKLLQCYGLFEEINADVEKFWTEVDSPGFHERVKQTKIGTGGLTLYRAVRLRPEEAEKLITYEDFYRFAEDKAYVLRYMRDTRACVARLCEIMTRGFFRHWALYPFWRLIHHRLPIEICELIVMKMRNEDLYHVILADRSLSQEDSKKDVSTNAIKCDNKRRLSESEGLEAPKKAKIYCEEDFFMSL